MKMTKEPVSRKKINTTQLAEWNRTVFNLFWKIWFVILFVQLFLFIFFEATPECSRAQYFKQFILIPSGLELVVLLGCQLIFTKLYRPRLHRTVSLYTIFLITAFAGITICVHTSVNMLQALLLVPMMLTPLYKDRLMTLVQAVFVIILYILSDFYFIPNASYILPDNDFSPYVELSIFIGATIATFFILERVYSTIMVNEDRSKHDSLTHLYNHESFYEELDYYRNRFEKKGKAFSVIIADIDNFKKVNDTYGHAFGDEVIRKVGKIFMESSKNDGFAARYGGEEFAMILPHMNPMAVAEKIRSDFESFDFETSEGNRRFTLSLGAAVYDKAYKSASIFFEEADNALYHAKRTGKNKVVLSGTYDAEDE